MPNIDDLPFEPGPEVRALFGGRDLGDIDPAEFMPPPGPVTRDDAAAQLAALAGRVRDGRIAGTERAELIGRLAREQWTQDAIAAAAGISQAAVSKVLRTTPGSRSLEESRSPFYLAGRLIGTALRLARDWRGASPLRSERMAEKIARGGLPLTVTVLGQLEALLARDVRLPGVPAVFREVFAEVTEHLGELAGFPPLPWSVAQQGERILGEHHQSRAITVALEARAAARN